MTVASLWSLTALGATEPRPVHEQPQLYLPGSPGVDLSDPQIWRDAQLLFPQFDASNIDHPQFLPELPDNYLSADGQDFVEWHQAHQVAYLADPARSTLLSVPADGGDAGFDARIASFGSGPGSTTVFLSADGKRAYTLELLQPIDVAQMPLADQRILAALPNYVEKFGDPYNLAPNGRLNFPGPAAARAGAIAVLDELRSAVTISADYVAGQRDSFLGDPTQRAENYPYYFLEELDLLEMALNAQAVFNFDEIAQRVDDIEARFDRLARFANMTKPQADGSDFPLAANASAEVADAAQDLDAVSQGRTIFVEIENRLWENALHRSFVAATGLDLGLSNILEGLRDGAGFTDYTTGFASIAARSDLTTLGARVLDGPGLLNVLQTLETNRKEAEADGKTEELNQINRLMQDYALMQKMVNETLTILSQANDPELKIGLLDEVLISALNRAPYGPAGITVAAMFDNSAAFANGNSGHPAEPQHPSGFERPTLELGGAALPGGPGVLAQFDKSVWDGFAQNLGDASRRLGQGNQILVGEINELTRGKNRNFDLASSALNRINQLLRELTTL